MTLNWVYDALESVYSEYVRPKAPFYPTAGSSLVTVRHYNATIGLLIKHLPMLAVG